MGNHQKHHAMDKDKGWAVTVVKIMHIIRRVQISEKDVKFGLLIRIKIKS